MENNLINDLFNDDLSDFFNSSNQKGNDDANKKSSIKKLIDVFNVNEKKFSLRSRVDISILIKAIDTVKKNIASIRAAYGDEVADKLLEIIPDEKVLMQRLMKLLEARMKKIEEARGNYALLLAEEEEFEKSIQNDSSLSSLLIFLAVAKMVEKRMEKKNSTQEGGSNSSMSDIITPEDKETYLKTLLKKLELIEKYTGVKLDNDLIEFFKSDEYAYSTNLMLPDILRDEDYTRIMNAWSLPILINDNREELQSKEIASAEDSIRALERYVAINGLGNTQDNPTIDLLSRLKNDVAEERGRVQKDIDFFKKEKLKERVECAILYSVKDQTQNTKLSSLTNALKETITSRINYMTDEVHLREARKNIMNDQSNKENERDSKDFLNALTNVNTAINKRREERALNGVQFLPKALVAKRIVDKGKANDNVKDEKAIESQSMSYGGRQKVLSYNRQNNFRNNINLAS